MLHFLLAPCKQKDTVIPMPVLPTLTKPHADKAAGLPEAAGSAPGEEIERRVQEILLEWQRLHFSGKLFTVEGEGDKTFEDCDVRWGTVTPEKPAAKPIIHIWVSQRRDDAPRRVPPALWQVKSSWVFTVVVKTNPQLPAGGSGAVLKDSAERESERLCRRVADQMVWLLNSTRTQALALLGVQRVLPASSPVLTANGSYIARTLTFSAEIYTHTPRNDP